MRVTKHTDYALRVLIYLAARPEVRVPTKQIAAAHGISLAHLHKVVAALGELGHVDMRRGAAGGVMLARDRKDISIGAVMRALDESSTLIECFDPELDHCVISPACELKSALRRAQEAFYAELDGLHLSDLVAGSRTRELRSLLAL